MQFRGVASDFGGVSIAASGTMLRLAGLLVVVLSSGAADAAPKRTPAKRPAAAVTTPRLQVVKVLVESGQAVLRDGKQERLVGVGETFAGYTLIEVDEDGATVGAKGKTFVLAPMPPPPTPTVVAPPAITPPMPTAPAPTAPAPTTELATPEAPPNAPTGAPADPYADEPVDPYVEVKPPSPTNVTGPEKPAVGPEKPAVGPQTEKHDAKAPAQLVTIELTRRDVDAALEDFGSLLVAMTGELTKDGAKLEAVTEGSLFARLGFRAGDTITSIDNKPLRSLDDAADLYARAGAVRVVTAQVLRGGKSFTLRVVIK